MFSGRTAAVLGQLQLAGAFEAVLTNSCRSSMVHAPHEDYLWAHPSPPCELVDTASHQDYSGSHWLIRWQAASVLPPLVGGFPYAHLAPPGGKRLTELPIALCFLEQFAYERHRVGVTVRVLRRLPGLQFDLQPNAIGVVEVEGLAVAPLDNLGDRYPVVL
jgi:hypothetical protein